MKENTRTIGIIGTGMIASSLAVLVCGHGFTCVVIARSTAAEERCHAAFKAHWDDLVSHGVATREQAEICEGYLVISQDYAALRDASLVFESVVENIDVKHEVYRCIDEHCPNLRAICSASSSIVADDLASGAGRYADRIVVTHPFNPAHMVPYVEICGGSSTAPGVIEYARDVLLRLDRKPVVLKRPTPGFIGNRLQFALWREALALVEEGIAEPRDIDTALSDSFCPRFTSIGIFEHFDCGGMQLNSAPCEALFPILSGAKEVPQSIRDLLASGKTGQKAGEGFYAWHDVDMQAYTERVNAPYWQFCTWDMPEA